MKVAAIIQARTGSTRLPGKVLLDLEGKTVLERIIDRLWHSKFVEEVLVATSIEKDDLEIVKLCADAGTRVYCGSEDDVLDRYYHAARLFKAQHIIRITGDCPLIDPEVMDKVIDTHLRENADYTSNVVKETYPDGLDVEVFTFEALQKAWEESAFFSEREHVTAYIKKNPEIFKIVGVESKTDLSRKRWTLDNKEDYDFIKIIYKRFCDKEQIFNAEQILKFLEENPDIEKVNNHLTRNEGYYKSLENDKLVR